MGPGPPLIDMTTKSQYKCLIKYYDALSFVMALHLKILSWNLTFIRRLSFVNFYFTQKLSNVELA